MARANSTTSHFLGELADGLARALRTPVARSVICEPAYKVHRWYEYGTGRYSRPDPLGLVDQDSFSSRTPDEAGGVRAEYSYATSNPVLMIDPDGLKSRTCCKVIRKTLFFRHCYIDTEDDLTGKRRTIGLLKAGFGSGKGEWGTDNNLDIQGPKGKCGPWNDTCGVDDCVLQNAKQYADPSKYRFVRGPNSNTFAKTLTDACNLKKPGIAGTWLTPGWNKSPAPPFGVP